MIDNTKMTILAIGAHPSDMIANCGGTLGKHAKRGDHVILLTLTYGLEVHTEKLIGLSEAEIRKSVQKQAGEAAAILGLHDLRFLDFGDSPLVLTREKILQLAEIIQEIQPDLIVNAHYPFRADQWGGDHGVAARLVEQCPTYRRHTGKKPYQMTNIWTSCTEYIYLNHAAQRVPDVYVDISDTMDLKIQACVKTWDVPTAEQPGLEGQLRKADGFFGLLGGVQYAEAFESPFRKKTVEYLG